MFKFKKISYLTIIFLLLVSLSSCQFISNIINKNDVNIDLVVTEKDSTFSNLENSLKTSDTEEKIKLTTQFYDDATVIVENYQNTQSGVALSSFGSGVIYKKDSSYESTIVYYVLTNRHVVEDGVKFNVVTNESSYSATLVGYSDLYDVAIVYFSVAAKNTDVINVAYFDTEELYKGEFVMAMGTPIDYEYFNSFTEGRISNFSDDQIQHTAAINSGNSGGSLYNLDGYLVGINNAKLSGDTSSGVSIDGIGFAVPIKAINKSITEIGSSNSVPVIRPVLGVSTVNVEVIVLVSSYASYSDIVLAGYDITLQNYNLFKQYSTYIPTGITTGCFVVNVVSESSAQVAGILANDIIYSVNNINVKDQDELKNNIWDSGIGSTVKFSVYRNKTLIDINCYLK